MTVLLSRSEIKSEVEKAIRGVGYDWGRAKDGGVMAAWLAGHNQVFLGGLLRGLDHAQQDEIKDASLAPCDAMLTAEYVVATEEDWSGHVIGLRFMIAAMGIVSQEQGATLQLNDSDGVIAHASSGLVWLKPDFNGEDRAVTLSAKENIGDEHGLEELAWSHDTAHEASASCWARLNALAFRVYVKETEEKRRSGAGAGDIDNS